MSKMTLERLALLMQGEFQVIQGEFRVVHGRIDALETRVSILEERMDRLEKEVSTLREEMHYGFQQILAMITELREELRARDYTPEIDELRARIGKVEKKLGL